MKQWPAEWIDCMVTEADEGQEEPDWSRVPEDKRELVRSRWSPKTVSRKFKLWGPQIPMFEKMGARVDVMP